MHRRTKTTYRQDSPEPVTDTQSSSDTRTGGQAGAQCPGRVRHTSRDTDYPVLPSGHGRRLGSPSTSTCPGGVSKPPEPPDTDVAEGRSRGAESLVQRGMSSTVGVHRQFYCT